MDFGCGDGRFAIQISQESPRLILCVDESPVMIQQTYRHLTAGKGKNVIYCVCGDESILPTKTKFDFVLCCLVLMMENDRARLDSTVSGLIDSLAREGKLLIILTHPCFPRGDHVDFQLQFSRSFSYWSSAAPLTVHLGPPGKESLEITDFHWTLQDYFLAIEKGEGCVRRLREYPARFDFDTGDPDTGPAYLLIEVSRTRKQSPSLT